MEPVGAGAGGGSDPGLINGFVDRLLSTVLRRAFIETLIRLASSLSLLNSALIFSMTRFASVMACLLPRATPSAMPSSKPSAYPSSRPSRSPCLRPLFRPRASYAQGSISRPSPRVPLRFMLPPGLYVPFTMKPPCAHRLLYYLFTLPAPYQARSARFSSTIRQQSKDVNR